MADDGVRLLAERRSGACLLRISGEIDLTSADRLGERADAAVRSVPGPVLVDLSGLTFIDAQAARALDAVLRTLPGGRPVSVRSCPSAVRRVFDLLRLSLDYARARQAGPRPGVPGTADRVRRARLSAAEARLEAAATLARLTDTCIRLSGTIERAGLVREQGRQALLTVRATRELVARSRRPVRPGASGY